MTGRFEMNVRDANLFQITSIELYPKFVSVTKLIGRVQSFLPSDNLAKTYEVPSV